MKKINNGSQKHKLSQDLIILYFHECKKQYEIFNNLPNSTFLICPGIPWTCIQLSPQLNTQHMTSTQIHIHIIVPDTMGPLQMLEALPLTICAQRGFCDQGFNLLVLISTSALFAYTLQVSLLAGNLIFFILILPAFLKLNKKEKRLNRH